MTKSLYEAPIELKQQLTENQQNILLDELERQLDTLEWAKEFMDKYEQRRRARKPKCNG